MTFPPAGGLDLERLPAYVADLELEVDRLRRQGAFIERTATDTLTRILRLCTGPVTGAERPTLAEVEATARRLVDVVRDLHDAPGYHPANDQVVAIAVRPLAERVFRWQQRLTGAAGVELRVAPESGHIEWFPARLRHVLDNLFAHVLCRRDPGVTDPWVLLELAAGAGGYQIVLSGHGVGLHPGSLAPSRDLLARTAPVRAAGLEVGLSVVRMLVEQSGGSLTVRPGADGRTEFALTLPRYDLLDYLE